MKTTELFSHVSPFSPAIRRPFIIAEAGVNHEGSMDTAKRLIELAREGGADAIKFQSYKAETITVRDSPAYWDLSQEATRSQFELFKKHDSFWKKEFEALKRCCEEQDIEFLSTPFDTESADFLNDLMATYKISSSDLTNRPFIEYLCGFGKPVLLSTGASRLDEVRDAVAWIDASGVPVALLHCVLNYPTQDQNANLGMILGLRAAFPGRLIGYSDHTLPGDMSILEMATLLGAVILEKHFTHDKRLPGNDHYHAMDRQDLQRFHKRLDALFARLGSFEVAALPSEAPARRHARRSLVAQHDLPKGHVIAREDLTWKRPAHGISPREIDLVVGMATRHGIPADSVIRWENLCLAGDSRSE